MPERTLQEIEQAIKAKLIVELELSETHDGFVTVIVKTGESEHEFCLPKQEDIALLVYRYMDDQKVLRDTAQSLEPVWNKLAFEGRVLTRFLYTHAEGLLVDADFRYSPLRSESPWQAALRENGLFIVQDLGSQTEGHRHVVLAKDKLLT